VLYLAEVKKQTKGFMGGAKAELKLLAYQHNDQTWSAIAGEETIVCDEIHQAGEGALVIVNLSNNRQMQGKPELAGSELVRQLQRLSRSIEKNKDQQEEIDRWKQSLSIQSEELNRRSMEMESQYEQIEQIQQEMAELERQRQQFQVEQQRLESLQKRIGPVDWNSPHIGKIQEIVGQLFANADRASSLEEQFQSARVALAHQQGFLDRYLQQLQQDRDNCDRQQNEVGQQGEAIKTLDRELKAIATTLENNKIQLQVQQNSLATKQELLGRVDAEIDSSEEIKKVLTGAGDTQTKQQVNIQALESMSLADLQELVKTLQTDFDKLVRFVNDQEEELSYQYQTVLELEEKLKTVSNGERFNLESEIEQEQENKKLLDETLMGQRRRLRERQSLLSQHLRVLRRRQGVMEIEDNLQQINLEPILLQLKEKKRNAQQERQRLEKEIEQLQSSIGELQQQIAKQESDRAAKTQQLQKQEENCDLAKSVLSELRAKIKLCEEAIQPLQENLVQTRQKVEAITQLFGWVEQSQALA
jgi:chromosome segregation ATPase